MVGVRSVHIISRNHSNALLLIDLQKKDLPKVKNIAVRAICSNNIFTALVGFFSIA